MLVSLGILFVVRLIPGWEQFRFCCNQLHFCLVIHVFWDKGYLSCCAISKKMISPNRSNWDPISSQKKIETSKIFFYGSPVKAGNLSKRSDGLTSEAFGRRETEETFAAYAYRREKNRESADLWIFEALRFWLHREAGMAAKVSRHYSWATKTSRQAIRFWRSLFLATLKKAWEGPDIKSS